MTDYLAQILALVRQQGPLIVFLLSACESIPLVGFIVPGVTVVILAGYLAAGGPADAGLLLFGSAVCGICLGDNFAYAAGRVLRNRSKRFQAYLSRHPAALAAIERQPRRVLIFFQFPPYLRMAAPAILGSLEMPITAWVALSVGATLIFVGAFFSIGLLIGISAGELDQGLYWSRLLQIAFGIGFAAWLILIVRRLRRIGEDQ